eukprot:COSAG01_NODE_263_length_19988_cov_19.806275_5_plen_122_part_00
MGDECITGLGGPPQRSGGGTAQGGVTVVASFPVKTKMGIIFGDRWPQVKRIQPNLAASKIVGLRAGCKLMAIVVHVGQNNETRHTVSIGDAVTVGFKEALPLLQVADNFPLQLLFQDPTST